MDDINDLLKGVTDAKTFMQVFFGTLLWVGLGLLGYWTVNTFSDPWGLLFGIPLYAVGAFLALNNIVNIIRYIIKVLNEN